MKPPASEVRPVAGWPTESGNSPITIGWEVRWPIWSIRVAMVRVKCSPWWPLLHPRDIGPLWWHLDLTTMQFRFIQIKSLLNSFLFKKFNVSKAFWLSKLVSQDRHSVDSSTSLKMLLYFLWSTSVINMSYLCTIQVTLIGPVVKNHTTSHTGPNLKRHLQLPRLHLLLQCGNLFYTYVNFFFSFFFSFSFFFFFFFFFFSLFLFLLLFPITFFFFPGILFFFLISTTRN